MARRKIDLNEGICDLEAEDHLLPDDRTIRKCLELARAIAPHVVFSKHARAGAFVEDGNTASLVVQSVESRRRINVKIVAHENHLTVVKIDERMNLTREDVAEDNQSRLREWGNAILS